MGSPPRPSFAARKRGRRTLYHAFRNVVMAQISLLPTRLRSTHARSHTNADGGGKRTKNHTHKAQTPKLSANKHTQPLAQGCKSSTRGGGFGQRRASTIRISCHGLQPQGSTAMPTNCERPATLVHDQHMKCRINCATAEVACATEQRQLHNMSRGGISRARVGTDYHSVTMGQGRAHRMAITAVATAGRRLQRVRVSKRARGSERGSLPTVAGECHK